MPIAFLFADVLLVVLDIQVTCDFEHRFLCGYHNETYWTHVLKWLQHTGEMHSGYINADSHGRKAGMYCVENMTKLKP